jgi:Na+/H+-dicarboxylate symporter
MVLSSGLLATPFLVALLRAFQSADLRLLFMAVASLLAALPISAGASKRPRSSLRVLAFSVATLIASTAFAAATAYALGATASPGVWAVAAALGACWAVRRAITLLFLTGPRAQNCQ